MWKLFCKIFGHTRVNGLYDRDIILPYCSVCNCDLPIQKRFMRNKYRGKCYKCGKMVEPQTGHFEKQGGEWAVIHIECVFEQRRMKEEISKQTA